MSARGGSSKRSTKKSDVDLQLKVIQMERNQSEDEDSASSFNEELDRDADGSTTLTICRENNQKRFKDEDSIKKHLNKKLAQIESF